MKSEVLEQIQNKFKERASVSDFECNLYARDLAPVPDLLVKPLFKTKPDILVRPADTTELALMLENAYKNNIPVTPRAGGSTVYFDSVPVKGGILLDLNLIKGIVELKAEEKTVVVRAGTTWTELEEYLQLRGFTCKSYPTSAPTASIGGWFAMMGCGIGSLKYGKLLSQLRSIEVVLPNGDIKKVTENTEPALSWFASSEGTLGVISELELEIRPITPMLHFLLQADKADDMLDVLLRLLNAEVIPYNLHFSDCHYNRQMNILGFVPDDIAGSYMLGVDFEGSPEELDKARDIVVSLPKEIKGINLLEESRAAEEWEERFQALRLKRGGPSQLGGEVWLPADKLVNYLEDIEKMDKTYKLGLVSYGHAVSPTHLTVMTMFYANETDIVQYITGLGMVKKIHDVGYKNQGYPYGVGLWNTPYISRIYDSAQLAELRRRKKNLDRQGTMNPGKVYHWPLLLNPFNFSTGCNIIAGFRRITGRG